MSLPGPTRKQCLDCGAAFECGMGLDTPCWCSAEFPAVMPLPATAQGCYCKDCLAAMIAVALQERKAT